MTRRWRTVHLDGNAWTYTIIHGTIEIRDPHHRKSLVDICHLPVMQGWTHDLLQRTRWKGNTQPAIKPSDIKHYIGTHLVRDQVRTKRSRTASE